jgi:hypothetical protein
MLIKISNKKTYCFDIKWQWIGFCCGEVAHGILVLELSSAGIARFLKKLL